MQGSWISPLNSSLTFKERDALPPLPEKSFLILAYQYLSVYPCPPVSLTFPHSNFVDSYCQYPALLSAGYALLDVEPDQEI